MVILVYEQETDFTDDRLTMVLRKLSQESIWLKIEKELNRNSIKIDDLRAERVRLDATTMSGHHLVSESGF